MEKKKLIVEVAMEISLTPELLNDIGRKFFPGAARESAMATSVGGIGPLLRDRMIAEADQGNEVIGISLLYEKVWVQRWQPWGQLFLEKKSVSSYIQRILSKDEKAVHVEMNDGSDVAVNIWKAAYGKATVYFLDVPGITTVVYPGVEDAPAGTENKVQWYEQMRIRQSWLLGRGALELLKTLHKKPDVIILSETPTMFAIHKLVHDRLKDAPHFEHTRYVFNDHTPLEYAHPVWPASRLKTLKVDPSFYASLQGANADPQKIDITEMLVAGVDQVYGVARIHGDVMRSMTTLKKYAHKITSITNGISMDFWQSPRFRNVEKVSDAELLARKYEEKQKLIDWVWRRYKFWSAWKEQALHKPVILWTRRITGYKRLDILTEIIKKTPFRERFIAADVTILLGGRVHQQDGISKQVLFDLLDCLSAYPDVENHIAMLDNYNVWEAPRLFHGIDATIMMSDKGKEASATGFMKAQVNGGLVIASPDGAIPESVIFYGTSARHEQAPNGFEIQYVNNSPTPETFLEAIESFARVYANEKERAAMIRSAIAMVPQVSIRKTVSEMLDLFNTPL